MDSATYWTSIAEHAQPEWVDEIAHVLVHAEQRRRYARFNTGSISATAALTLRALCAAYQPSTVIEVGTFIGVSTFSLKAGQIYSCDISNDCVPSRPGLKTHPYTKSTAMFRDLERANVEADLFFFDGLLSPEDPPLVVNLSAPGAVYVFDDYNAQFKGVKNVEKLFPRLQGYRLFPADGPIKSDTTFAALVPEWKL
jgi:predicted O-methyltransferase YrrM